MLIAGVVTKNQTLMLASIAPGAVALIGTTALCTNSCNKEKHHHVHQYEHEESYKPAYVVPSEYRGDPKGKGPEIRVEASAQ